MMGARGPKGAAEVAMIMARRRAVRQDRVETAPGLPLPPPHLEPATKDWWMQIVADWPVEQHQFQTLQAAAESWDRCQQAREALALHGLTYVDGKGMIRARPEVAIERDSRISYIRCMRELNFEDIPPPTTSPKPWEDDN